MGLLFKLGLRNLLRQKRRNLFLGIGIGFGMMILTVASAFSHGMVEVLINDIARHAFGHIVIESKPGNSPYQFIGDKQRIMALIRDNIKKTDLFNIDEELQMYGQVIGNGATDNVTVVGVFINNQKEREIFDGFFSNVNGSIDDFFSKTVAYPVIISEQEAETLNVKLHDTIRIRLPMVTGQIQAAALYVAAIVSPNNTFMNVCLFLDANRLKNLLGYKPWESGSLKVTLNNPSKTAQYYADVLHRKLRPRLLALTGKVKGEKCTIYGVKNDVGARALLQNNLVIKGGDPSKAFAKDSVLLSDSLARRLGLKIGDRFTYEYPTKFKGLRQEEFVVNAIYKSNPDLNPRMILAGGERLYDLYNKYIPLRSAADAMGPHNRLLKAFATEWKLLDRSKDSDELQKRYNDERRFKTDQITMNVVTMYEGASGILKLEGVFNLITLITVLILMFIILIGVVNTLRMTIKERTREIGTIRAIGMPKKEVRNIFILETLMLTVFSCGVGVIMGIAVMKLLGVVEFKVTNALGMILRNNRIFFKLDPVGTIRSFLLIMVITFITAYFPARRGSNLRAADALRHFE
jgi:ABC-type lipoprotein release transport system permease subunit